MRGIRPLCGLILAVLFLAICSLPQTRALFNLPEEQKIVVGDKCSLELPASLDTSIDLEILQPSQSVFAAPLDAPVSIVRNSKGYEITALKPGKVDLQVKLLGAIPVKSIAVESLPVRRVVVGGHSIGVVLQSKGIMVVGFAPIVDQNGEKAYPARDMGIQIGDLIMDVDGIAVRTEAELARVIDEKQGKSFTLHIKRKMQRVAISVKALLCQETQRYRIGLYVRDGVVGVGTLTFWEPESGQYAALGHVIMDADTRQGIDVMKGKIITAAIQNIKPGKPGRPGEKIGIFQNQGDIEGNIVKNTDCGIFGKMNKKVTNPLATYTMEIGYAHQVKTGPAQIYTVVNGTSIEKFDIMIEKVYPERENGKGMVLKITDPQLLSLTGGIIQGMSGSPIIQDGKLVGAVTHVFLNDPQRGYGIFVDNILSEMNLFTSAEKEFRQTKIG